MPIMAESCCFMTPNGRPPPCCLRFCATSRHQDTASSMSSPPILEKDHKVTTHYPRKIKLTDWLLRPMGCGVLDCRKGVSGDFEMQGLTPVIVAAALLTAGAVGAAVGAECPGNPDALGVSRTIVVDPIEHPRL